MAYFFFSSRRRHTRSLRDWSSDVCSSDLALKLSEGGSHRPLRERPLSVVFGLSEARPSRTRAESFSALARSPPKLSGTRSEERRVGKECRSRWWANHEQKK